MVSRPAAAGADIGDGGPDGVTSKVDADGRGHTGIG